MPRLTPEDFEYLYTTNWNEKISGATERLAKLEAFELKLFDRLNEADLADGSRERITGVDADDLDGGLLDHVGREIRSLLRSLPLWQRNVELRDRLRAAWRAREAAAITALINRVTIPHEISRWAAESCCSSPESLP